MITLAPPLRQPLQITPHGAYGEPRPARNGTHYGLDFAAHRGDPVFAAAAGKVARTGTDPPVADGGHGGGRYVILQHTDGAATYETGYMHLEAVAVPVGADVRAGDVIGAAGDSGTANGGVHLHFELRHIVAGGRQHIDPTPLLANATAPPGATDKGGGALSIPVAFGVYRLLSWLMG